MEYSIYDTQPVRFGLSERAKEVLKYVGDANANGNYFVTDDKAVRRVLIPLLTKKFVKKTYYRESASGRADILYTLEPKGQLAYAQHLEQLKWEANLVE